MSQAIPPRPLYAPRRYGTKAVQRLGEALASGRRLNDAESALWLEFSLDAQDRASAATGAVRDLIHEPVLTRLMPRVAASEVTGRAKTRRTLVEKLQRTPDIKLTSVHDVAGVRLVGNFSVFEQERTAETLASALPERFRTSRPPQVIDRLKNASFGYRAVHVIIWPEGRPVEVQIRTELQHAWAELMEVLGDRWGREPRYGDPVVHEDDQERDRRQSVVDALIGIGQNIADFEQASVGSGLAHVHIPSEVLSEVGLDPDPFVEAQRYALALEPEVDAQRQNLLRALAQFGVDADLARRG